MGVTIRCSCPPIPPTQCGIATFTAVAGRATCSDPAPTSASCASSTSRRCRSSRSCTSGSPVAAAPRATRRATLDDFDVAMVQHEYGIFGGPDGEDVLDVVCAARQRPDHHRAAHRAHPPDPAPAPDPGRRSCARVRALVTMTETARGPADRGLGRRPRARSPSSRTAPSTTARPRPRPRTSPDAADHPHLGPARPRARASSGRCAPWPSCADAVPARSTASSGRPTRGCSSARARPTATGCVGLTRDLDLEDHVDFDDRYLPSDRAAPDRPRRPTSSCCPTTRRSRSPRACSPRRWPPASRSCRRAFPHAVELLSGGAGLARAPARPGGASPTRCGGCSPSPGCAASMARESRAAGRRRCSGPPCADRATSTSAAVADLRVGARSVA